MRTEFVLLVAGLGCGLYLLRLSGFALGGLRLPPLVEQGLRFVPTAVFAALLAPRLAPGGAAATPAGVLALLVAGLLAWRTRRPALSLFAGGAAYLLAGWW